MTIVGSIDTPDILLGYTRARGIVGPMIKEIKIIRVKKMYKLVD